MPDIQNNNGWTEWGKYVLKELEDLNTSMARVQSRLTEIEKELVRLQTRAGAWGAVLGVLGGGIVSFIVYKLVGK